jgi:hexosaminidase
MKKALFFLLYFMSVLTSVSQTPAIAIIPEPVSVKPTNGTFLLPKNVVIKASSQPAAAKVLQLRKERFTIPTGSRVEVLNRPPLLPSAWCLNRNRCCLARRLLACVVTPKKIVISANEPEGLFYGAQTLVQLFLLQLRGATAVKDVKWEAPAVEIMDYQDSDGGV